MPITVPRYRENVPTQPLPATRLRATASPQALGAGAGAALASAAAEVVRVEQDKADQIAFLASDRRLADWEAKSIYDPQAGALNQRGRQAFDLPERVMDSYERLVSEIEGGLTSDRQRLAFRRAAEQRRQGIQLTLQRHVASEIQAFDRAETDAYIQNAHQAALANYQDPERVELEIARQRAAYLDVARRNGLPAELVHQQITDAVSSTRAGVIDRMLAAGLDRAAQTYYQTHRDDIAGGQAAQVEKALEEGSLRGESQRRADTIVAQAADLKAADDLVRRIDDPKLRDAVSSRVKDYYATRSAAEQERREQIFMSGSEAIEQSGDLSAIPPGSWVQLTPAQRQALEARARQVRRGIEPAQNDRAWLKFLDLDAKSLSSMTEAQLHEQYRPYLDHAHWDRASAMWQDARQAARGEKRGSAPKLSATLTFKDRVDNALRSTGVIDPNKSKAKFSEAEAQRYARFEQAAAAAVEHYELTQLNGQRKATGDEMQTLIDELVIRQVFVKEWGRDPQLPVVVLTPEQLADAYVTEEDIPAREREVIKHLIRSAGGRITVDKIERAYIAYIQGDRVLFDAILAEKGGNADGDKPEE